MVVDQEDVLMVPQGLVLKLISPAIMANHIP